MALNSDPQKIKKPYQATRQRGNKIPYQATRERGNKTPYQATRQRGNKIPYQATRKLSQSSVAKGMGSTQQSLAKGEGELRRLRDSGQPKKPPIEKPIRSPIGNRHQQTGPRDSPRSDKITKAYGSGHLTTEVNTGLFAKPKRDPIGDQVRKEATQRTSASPAPSNRAEKLKKLRQATGGATTKVDPTAQPNRSAQTKAFREQTPTPIRGKSDPNNLGTHPAVTQQPAPTQQAVQTETTTDGRDPGPARTAPSIRQPGTEGEVPLRTIYEEDAKLQESAKSPMTYEEARDHRQAVLESQPEYWDWRAQKRQIGQLGLARGERSRDRLEALKFARMQRQSGDKDATAAGVIDQQAKIEQDRFATQSEIDKAEIQGQSAVDTAAVTAEGGVREAAWGARGTIGSAALDAQARVLAEQVAANAKMYESDSALRELEQKIQLWANRTGRSYLEAQQQWEYWNKQAEFSLTNQKTAAQRDYYGNRSGMRGVPTVADKLRGAKFLETMRVNYENSLLGLNAQLNAQGISDDPDKKKEIETRIDALTASYLESVKKIEGWIGQGSNQNMERTPDEMTAGAMNDLEMEDKSGKSFSNIGQSDWAKGHRS